MKVFYQDLSASKVQSLLANDLGERQQTSLGELDLHSKSILDDLRSSLKRSTEMLPVLARKFQEWDVGMMHRVWCLVSKDFARNLDERSVMISITQIPKSSSHEDIAHNFYLCCSLGWNILSYLSSMIRAMSRYLSTLWWLDMTNLKCSK